MENGVEFKDTWLFESSQSQHLSNQQLPFLKNIVLDVKKAAF